MPEFFSKRLVDRRAVLKAMFSTGAGMLTLDSFKGNALGGAGDSRDVLANVPPSFTVESRKMLQEILASNSFSGQVPLAAVHELLSSGSFQQKSVADLMLALLPVARTFSRPPISNYQVGTVARGMSGGLYFGFNIEFPGQALGSAVHGEQAALSSAYMHGEEAVSGIALTAAPCGHCRQFMNELSPDGQIDIFVDKAAPTKLSSLLPLAFGPKDLGRTEGAFPVKQAKLIATASGIAPGKTDDSLFRNALDAARTSYAPYTEAHSGAAIATRSGRIYRGSYIENVAFNPSLSPLQSALVQLIVAGDDYSAMSRVALVEIKGAKISQQGATEAVLRAIAPAVPLELFAATLQTSA